MTPTPGARLLDFAARCAVEALPEPVRETARLAVLDWWGVTVAGAEAPVARALRRALLGPGAGAVEPADRGGGREASGRGMPQGAARSRDGALGGTAGGHASGAASGGTAPTRATGQPGGRRPGGRAATVAGALPTEVPGGVSGARPGSQGPESAAVLGTGLRAAPVDAALLNGTAAHALDYDDVHLALPGHLGAPLLPGLVALAEARGLGGGALLGAFVAGVEVAARVGRALAPGHYRAGWHATATMGRLGAAVAAGRLLGLDAAGLDTALGLAAAQAGGLQEAFGTMAKPVPVGRAAADGLLAALAAEAGVTGPRGLLDQPGWARRLSADWAPARLADALGEAWAAEALIFKRYPCCFAIHAAVRALLGLRGALGAAPVEAVELEVGPTTRQVADQREPETGLAAKFSVSYCAAAALLRGGLGEADFADAAVGDPAVRALARRVTLRVNPAFAETEARATVVLAGGARRQGAADLSREPDRAGRRRELHAKFHALVAPRLGAAEAVRLAAALDGLDALGDLRALTRPEGPWRT